ncbi:MAG: putative drug exporter of the superfamily [Actinomycetota bacterium]|jgi:RND superfamily putative drug exporter
MLLLWIGLLVGVSVLGSAFAGEHSMSFSTPGADSEKAQALLESRFAARSGETIDVVFEADQGVQDPAVRARVEALLAKADQESHVTGVVSPYTPEGARQIAPDGKIAFAALRLDSTYEEDFPIAETRHLITLADDASGDGVEFDLSGFAVQFAEQPEFGSEFIGIGVAALILLISFGSLLAMGLPILTAMVGLTIGTGIIGLLTNVLEVPDFAPLVAAMIGIGVGIDYVLFIVTRYRASLQTGHEPREAVITAINTSGRAVLFAGCTVIISLLGLFLMNLGFLRGLAVASISIVLVVMLASVTLLPALLGFVGKTIDRLHVPFVAKNVTGDRNSLSYRWSRLIQRRPLPAALVCAAVLIGLALPLFGLRFGFPDAGTSPSHYTSRQGYDRMAKGFGAGINGPLLLVAEGSGDLEALRQRVAATDGVVFVAPPVTSPDGQANLLLTYPKEGPSSSATVDLVHQLRDDVLPQTTSGSDLQVYVGGSTAASVDNTQYVSDRLLLFIGAVIVLSFLLLLVVFRSVLVPLKAAVMNVLSISAAYGVVSLAVKGGWFGGLFGIHEPVPVPSFVPMMMFAIVFGLSMDYEVFLLSRVREEYVKTKDNASAVADGLAATARVITAAAAIMISVFLAFVLGEDVVGKVMGIGLATAILVDATLVRMVLVPATMELLGDANWWLPKWLDRLLPEFHVEGESEEELQAELDQLAHDDAARVS